MQSIFDVENENCFHFVPHFFLAKKSYAKLLYRERRKKREEFKRVAQQPLPPLACGSLSLEWSQSLCLSICLSFRRKSTKERREIFDPQTASTKSDNKKNEYIKNNDDDKRAPMPAKRRRGCKQQTIKREQQQTQQQQ